MYEALSTSTELYATNVLISSTSFHYLVVFTYTRWDSNPQLPKDRDFKSLASTNCATSAGRGSGNRTRVSVFAGLRLITRPYRDFYHTIFSL